MRMDVVRADKVAKGLSRGGVLALAALLCAPGCSSSDGGPELSKQREALSSLSAVMGFESVSDWSSPQAQLASSVARGHGSEFTLARRKGRGNEETRAGV